MAKMSLAEKRKLAKSFMDAVNKDAGEVRIGFVDDPEMEDQLTIKRFKFKSNKLNAATGGGIPRGRLTIITGLSDSGKTSAVLEVIAIAQEEDPDLLVFWLETEASVTKEQMQKFGIDISRVTFSNMNSEGAGESAIDIVNSAVQSGAYGLVAINSLKGLTPSKEFTNLTGGNTIGEQARMFGKMTRKLTTNALENEVAVVVTNHMFTNIGGYGDPMEMSGGHAIRFASMLTLRYSSLTPQDKDPITKATGKKIKVKVMKNHCNHGDCPYKEAEYFVDFAKGTLVDHEILESCFDLGYLVKGGAWIREDDPATGDARALPDGTIAKWNGINKLRSYLEENPSYFQYLKDKVLNNGITGVETMSESEIAEIEAADSKLEEEIKKEEDGTSTTKTKKTTKKK